jgi:hypothetical protein
MSPRRKAGRRLPRIPAILTIVVWLAFRERRLGKTIDPSDVAAQQASDSRVLIVVFGAIFGGMFLTILVAWLVFF